MNYDINNRYDKHNYFCWIPPFGLVKKKSVNLPLPLLFAWGRNTFGQLGTEIVSASEISPVKSMTDGLLKDKIITKMSTAGSSSAILTSDNFLYTWGDNFFGQLGIGNNNVVAPIIQGPVLTSIKEVSMSDTFCIALKLNGELLSWGNNFDGQLGNGGTVTNFIPSLVVGTGGTGTVLENVISISAGYSHVLALLSGGSLVAWGLNTSGQLGDGTISPSLIPKTSATGHNFIKISTLDNTSMGIDINNELWCWGNNLFGQVGDNTNINRNSPVQVVGVGGTGTLGNIVEISGGSDMSVALDNSGNVYTWGRNNFGQLGNGTTVPNQVKIPVKVNLPEKVKAISAGASNVSALTVSGKVYSWGSGFFGEMGNGLSTGSNPFPILVLTDGYPFDKEIKQISRGASFILALT